MRRLWRRLPVIVRAVVVGWVVSGVGHQVSGVLFYANLQWWRAVPWSAPLVILWLWMFWQYFGGRWWPASTSQARAEGLAARPLSPRMWRWALVAGGLGMISIALLSIVLSPITPKTFKVFYSLFVRMPFPTVVVRVITLSAVAGIVEEAGFRGYMQGMIERRHGPVVAIAITTFFFVIVHFGGIQAMNAPRALGIAVASVMYGLLAHLARSIVPGIILHTLGDAFGVLLLWFYWKYGTIGNRLLGFAAASRSPIFWLYVAGLIVFTAASVWAFRRLADARGTMSGK
ncbi:MAG TPA: CPBP family intramembrane glutamic endopeptidase [Thermoanaerobaculia bacterium]